MIWTVFPLLLFPFFFFTRIFFPAGFLQSILQQIFNLPVHAPEFIIGPFSKKLIGISADAKYKTFFQAQFS